MILPARELISKIPPEIKKDLLFLSETIKSKGHSCYVIGGSVRDLIMGNLSHEYDLTTSMHPEDVKKSFKKVIETGIQHGTVTVLLGNHSYEVTTFRKDVDYTDGRRPDRIEYGVSLSEDMKRRDFTMNAIALDMLEEVIVDENKGLEDIQNKIIRTIGIPEARFGEDGLRPIRAIRFMSTLNFTIEENTYKAIYSTRNITAKISHERFHDELNKILKSNHPSVALKELYKNDIYSLFADIPAVSRNVELLEDVNRLVKEPLGLRLAYVLNFLFENTGDSMKQAEVFLKSVRYSKQNSKDALFFLDLLHKNIVCRELNKVSVRKILSNFVNYTGKRSEEEFLLAFYSLLSISQKESEVKDFRSTCKEILSSNDPLVLANLAVNGDGIIKEFPALDKKLLGKILRELLELCFENPASNIREVLLGYISKKY